MLILVVGIFYTWIAYARAKQKNISPIRWALIVAATFIATQILVAGGIGFIFGFGEEYWGWSTNLFEAHQIHITIISLLASALTNWLALRQLEKASKQ